ncbi:hypothetical protein AAUPMC_04816, partial [Pasteurella multocida subsp. multocida str. Anand1_cattle]
MFLEKWYKNEKSPHAVNNRRNCGEHFNGQYPQDVVTTLVLIQLRKIAIPKEIGTAIMRAKKEVIKVPT